MHALQAGDPQQVGGYRLLGRLGAGAMGEVFYAETRSARPIAVKIVRTDLADNPEFRIRFAREVAAMRTVGGFWTAAVVDADTDADRPWFATEYIAGPSLAQAAAETPLDHATCRALTVRLAEASSSIHHAGLIHRDLKPSNVILGRDGPKVIDFGIARALTAADHTLTHGVIGTPAYMSPEHLRGETLEPASDIWALGATIVYAATGHAPFDGPTIEATIHNILTRPAALDDIPADLATLLTGCLAKDPTARLTSAQLLASIPPEAAAIRTRFGDWRPPTTTSAYQPGRAALRRLDHPSAATTVAREPAPTVSDEQLPPTRLDRSQPAAAAPPAATVRPEALSAENRLMPWQSVPVLVATMLVVQVLLGLAVVVRDLVSYGPLAEVLNRDDPTIDTAATLMFRFRTTDGFLFAVACVMTLLIGVTLVYAVYGRPHWRTWAAVTSIIAVVGYSINALDLITRILTTTNYYADMAEAKANLDHATPWYTVIAVNTTLLSLLCAVLVLTALVRTSARLQRIRLDDECVSSDA